MLPDTAWNWPWRWLDHAATNVRIAGTCTPFTLLSGHGAALTAGLWGAAALGIGLTVVSPGQLRRLALALRLGMGWAGVVAGQAMLAALPDGVKALMLAGGLTFAAGVAVFLWKALPFHMTAWHVFVLVVSLLFYAAVVALVTGGA